MRIIGIDTSTAAGGVALAESGRLVAEYTLQLTAAHSERLMPALQQVMADAGWEGSSVDAIAVVLGPGSFTGLRIGVATAKALAYTWQIPVVGVSALTALAWQVGWAGQVVVPMVDARRQTVYTQVFTGLGSGEPTDSPADPSPGPQPLGEPGQVAVKDFLEQLEAQYGSTSIVVAGDGALRNLELLKPFIQAGKITIPPGSGALLRAAAVVEVGQEYLRKGVTTDPMTLVPLYLRKSEAEIKWEACQ